MWGFRGGERESGGFDVVVGAAESAEVCCGGVTDGPGCVVVDVAAFGRAGAAGYGALAIAQHDVFAQEFGHLVTLIGVGSDVELHSGGPV